MSYPHYGQRNQISLDGLWDFCWLGTSVLLKNFNPDNVVFTDKMPVPGVFDMSVEYFQKRGLGVYRKKITRLHGNKFRLHSGGIGLSARIFFDGKEIGKTFSPYLPEDFDFCADSLAEHELIIAADNRFQSQDYLFFRDYYDFYGFGGIYRSLMLYELPDVFLDRVQVRTLDETTGFIHADISCGGQVSEKLSFALAFDNGSYQNYILPVSNNNASLECCVPNFKIWSPEAPNLHEIHVKIENDEITERFGIRRIECKNQQILLNGKKIRIRGVNRHCTHPETGPVESLQLMAEDLHLIKNAGFNFIRCVHYPQNQDFLDLCDEMGILCWEESLGWGLNNPNDLTPDSLPLFITQNAKMIHASYNHPSIIIWAYLNECASNLETSISFYQGLTNHIHKLDPSRPVSYASDKKGIDVCFSAADIISINCYPGWFADIQDSETLASDLINPHLSRMADYFSKPEFADKPLLISEIGVCALYGIRDRNLAQWSEDFQADYMTKCCEIAEQIPRYCGFTLWQFVDSRSYCRGQIRGKPRGFNCAGIVDEYRRPKLAYDAIREYLKTNKTN